MRSATSYDTKLNPHGPSLSGCAWLCHQSVLLPAPFFPCPTSQLRCAITFFPLHKPPTKLLGFEQLSSKALRSRSQIYRGPSECWEKSGWSPTPHMGGGVRRGLILLQLFAFTLSSPILKTDQIPDIGTRSAARSHIVYCDLWSKIEVINYCVVFLFYCIV